MKTVVNVAEIAAPGWNFVEEHYADPRIRWQYCTATPQNWVEQIIKRPKLGRYRACLQATRMLQQSGDVVISHLPRTTRWQSDFMHYLGRHHRHLAFAFNFTDLPRPRLIRQMSTAFARVERFVVFSTFEAGLYPKLFDLDERRFVTVRWAATEPETEFFAAVPTGQDYYSSVGGEGRDYATLIEAFRAMPAVRLVIVCRPANVRGLDIPSNVEVFTDLPHGHFWDVVKRSKAVILPLRDDRTACGHITLVAAMAMGKAVLASTSKGIEDYFFDGRTGRAFDTNSARALSRAVQECEESPDARVAWGEFNRTFARDSCSIGNWVRVVRNFVDGRDPNGLGESD